MTSQNEAFARRWMHEVGMTWFQLVRGQVVEAWDTWNLGGLIQSLKQ